jgi:hypothetical protein
MSTLKVTWLILPLMMNIAMQKFAIMLCFIMPNQRLLVIPIKKQYGINARLKKFAEHGSAAIMKELCQFHALCCFNPKDPKTLTRDDCCKALASLMFLTEKRSGEIKARGCADGSKQRDHIAKEEATAPTVSADAICLQGTIFAHERCDVATCNILGAFLQADDPDYVLMRLDGILAELPVSIAPNIYCKYITVNAKGKPVLYLQLEKALYGMMKSALLFLLQTRCGSHLHQIRT